MGLFRHVGVQIHQFVDMPSGRGSAVRRAVIATLFFGMLVTVFANALAPAKFDVQAGQIAPEDIKAPREIVNRVRTERMREEAAALVADVFVQDTSVVSQSLAEIERVWQTARIFRDDDSLELNSKVSGVMEAADTTERSATAFIRAEDSSLDALLAASKNLVATTLEAGVDDATLEQQRKAADDAIAEWKFSKDLRVLASGPVMRAIKPNMVQSVEETLKKRQQARDAVEPAIVLKGQIIVRTGEIVTDDHVALLRDLKVIKHGPDLATLAAAVLYALLICVGLWAYLWKFHREFLLNDSRLLLVAVVFASSLMFSVLMNRVSGYLMPIASGTMLLAVIVDARFALLGGIALSIASGIVGGPVADYLFLGLVGGTAGVFGMHQVAERSDIIKAGLVVSVANVLGIMSLDLMAGKPLADMAALGQHTWGIMNGVVSAVLTLGLLPFFEGLFGVITPVKLIELSNPNHPLLKRLLVEAPGTYYHSVIVGNLAEAAVEAVGGDSLLARVGAYYHDVGKIRRPYFFIENQMGVENPHDKTSPTLSTLIITSHVKDGVELAREHKVPERIIDFIREHHGTSLVTYFYSRATEGDKAQEYSESDFRYDGPRPSSKETAVVMIADSVEAAVRSLGRPTPARIEALVKKIIRDKLNDHQLDRCDLTLRDLDTLTQVFTRVLAGLFHPRIEYPESREEAKKNADVSNRAGTSGG